MGNAGIAVPAQAVIVVPKLNAGVTIGLIVTFKLAVRAHWPASGVNVYVPEFALSIVDGLHVPVIPFVEVVGNAGGALPAHIENAVPNVNEGVAFGVTVTLNETGTEHWPPPPGVNVYVFEF